MSPPALARAERIARDVLIWPPFSSRINIDLILALLKPPDMIGTLSSSPLAATATVSMCRPGPIEDRLMAKQLFLAGLAARFKAFRSSTARLVTGRAAITKGQKA